MSLEKKGLLAAIVLMTSFSLASAHRLDEYLQATTIDLAQDLLTLRLRLTPGVDVAERVLKQIDQNGDGILTPQEQHAYALQVARGLTFSLNGKTLPLRLAVSTFPAIAELKAGTGVISLQFNLRTFLKRGSYHLAYLNRGSGPDTVWLVNCLVPHDPSLHILGQKRSVDQASYALDFLID